MNSFQLIECKEWRRIPLKIYITMRSIIYYQICAVDIIKHFKCFALLNRTDQFFWKKFFLGNSWKNVFLIFTNFHKIVKIVNKYSRKKSTVVLYDLTHNMKRLLFFRLRKYTQATKFSLVSSLNTFSLEGNCGSRSLIAVLQIKEIRRALMSSQKVKFICCSLRTFFFVNIFPPPIFSHSKPFRISYFVFYSNLSLSTVKMQGFM